jgi:DNA polymerase (family 10)
MGIPFAISVDAHSTRALHNIRFGVAMARRAGLTKKEVLNTRSAAAFARAVKPA